MKVKYIRRDIPEEISEEGGAYVQLVGKNTMGLSASIKEAIRTLYCVGEASLIDGYFFGLCRSVFAGIKADGAARCIGDIRFYPVCGGTFDLEKGWDPLVNDVRIKAQLVNGVELDISDWQFEDVTEGRVAFSIESISDGEVAGRVSTNKNVQVNGKNFPPDARVSWVCGTKSGTVPAAQLTRTVSRLDIDKAAFSTLTSADDGKEIAITVKGSYNKATKSAVVKYVTPVPEATWEGTYTTTGGSLYVGGTAGAQLAALYRTEPTRVYERVALYMPDGTKMDDNPVQATADNKLQVSASAPENPSSYVGQTFTLKVKVTDSEGTLHELSHGYVMTQA